MSQRTFWTVIVLPTIVVLLLFAFAATVLAEPIVWRDTLDQVNTNIADAELNGGQIRIYQIDTMKEVEYSREAAQQLCRLTDETAALKDALVIALGAVAAALAAVAAAITALGVIINKTVPAVLLPGEKVDVNTADAAKLALLPGIGNLTATRIIAYREANGPFTQLTDLDNVDGIGPSLIAAIADLITF